MGGKRKLLARRDLQLVIVSVSNAAGIAMAALGVHLRYSGFR